MVYCAEIANYDVPNIVSSSSSKDQIEGAVEGCKCLRIAVVLPGVMINEIDICSANIRQIVWLREQIVVPCSKNRCIWDNQTYAGRNDEFMITTC